MGTLKIEYLKRSVGQELTIEKQFDLIEKLKNPDRSFVEFQLTIGENKEILCVKNSNIKSISIITKTN